MRQRVIHLPNVSRVNKEFYVVKKKPPFLLQLKNKGGSSLILTFLLLNMPRKFNSTAAVGLIAIANDRTELDC